MFWEGSPAEDWAAAWRVPLVVLFDSTTSTNDRARELAVQGAPHFTVVLADQQTAGRGQHGRSWQTGAGKAILLSFILRMQQLPAPQLLPLRIGIAVARAIEARAPIAVQLKWPNDVLIDGRKVGGILCEGSANAAEHIVIAGIGLNVLQNDHEWPPELRASATSISEHASLTRAELVSAIVHELRFTPFHQPGLNEEELQAWQQRDALRGKLVRVDDHCRGTALGIARDGALRIQTGSALELIRTGTVRIDGGIS